MLNSPQHFTVKKDTYKDISKGYEPAFKGLDNTFSSYLLSFRSYEIKKNNMKAKIQIYRSIESALFRKNNKTDSAQFITYGSMPTELTKRDR